MFQPGTHIHEYVDVGNDVIEISFSTHREDVTLYRVMQKAMAAAINTLQSEMAKENNQTSWFAPMKEESTSQTPNGASFRDKLAMFKQNDSGKPPIPQKPTLPRKPVMNTPMKKDGLKKTHQKKEYNTNSCSGNDAIASIKERMAQITGKNTASDTWTYWDASTQDYVECQRYNQPKKQSEKKTDTAGGKKPQSGKKTATAGKKKQSEKKTATAEKKKPSEKKTATAEGKKPSEKKTATAGKKKPQSGKKTQRTCGICKKKFMTNFTGENPSCYSCFKNKN
jgi:hypothetical protein